MEEKKFFWDCRDGISVCNYKLLIFIIYKKAINNLFKGNEN